MLVCRGTFMGRLPGLLVGTHWVPPTPAQLRSQRAYTKGPAVSVHAEGPFISVPDMQQRTQNGSKLTRNREEEPPGQSLSQRHCPGRSRFPARCALRAPGSGMLASLRAPACWAAVPGLPFAASLPAAPGWSVRLPVCVNISFQSQRACLPPSGASSHVALHNLLGNEV